MLKQQPRRWPWSGIKTALDVVATLAMAVAACMLVWAVIRSPARRPSSPPSVPTDPVSIDGAATLGTSTARVAIVEFSDFQCPYCRKFAKETLPELKAKYIDSGLVKFVFRHNPLTTIHAQARAAAEAAECAGRQGKFWDVHDRFFQDPPKLMDADLIEQARAVGVDLSEFRKCLAGQTADRVSQDTALARTLKLSGTPAFLIGRVESERVYVSRVIPGATPFADMAAALDQALAIGDGRKQALRSLQEEGGRR